MNNGSVSCGHTGQIEKLRKPIIQCLKNPVYALWVIYFNSWRWHECLEQHLINSLQAVDASTWWCSVSATGVEPKTT